MSFFVRASDRRAKRRPFFRFCYLLLVIRLERDFLLLKIDKQLIGVIIQTGIPNLHELRRDLDQNFRVLVGILVVASPKVLFPAVPLL